MSPPSRRLGGGSTPVTARKRSSHGLDWGRSARCTILFARVCLRRVDLARATRLWLEQAREAYGGDLPVRAPGQLRAITLVPAAPAAIDVPPDRSPASEPLSAVARQELLTASPAAPPPTDPAADLEALRTHIGPCTRCKLAQGRTQVVFGDGSPTARVMFIGEAPGFHEDRQGLPFVGAAGQLLDRIIENAMGLRRADTYIANINKCRPPDNREPEPDEVAACLPFLRQQVRIIRPAVIVCLGRVASSNLLGTSLPMRALRGRELKYEGIPVVVTWHPAYLLRNPAAKGETWVDIKRVNRLLGLPERPERSPAAEGSP